MIPDSLSSGCYSQIAGRDTANLQIENKGGNVTGHCPMLFFRKIVMMERCRLKCQEIF